VNFIWLLAQYEINQGQTYLHCMIRPGSGSCQSCPAVHSDGDP